MRAGAVVAAAAAAVLSCAACTAGPVAMAQDARAAAPGTALAVLASLPIRPDVHVPGYSRARFKHWSDPDRDGCDGREQAIARAAGARSDCPAGVVSVPDAYAAGQVLVRDAEGDHVLSLHEAWDAGASRWTARQREVYANDPLVVVMTRDRINEHKSDNGPDQFRTPDPADECGYVARFVAVEREYGLPPTVRERDAMRRVLGTCPDQEVPH